MARRVVHEKMAQRMSNANNARRTPSLARPRTRDIGVPAGVETGEESAMNSLLQEMQGRSAESPHLRRLQGKEENGCVRDLVRFAVLAFALLGVCQPAAPDDD